jgi:hypothetical protein
MSLADSSQLVGFFSYAREDDAGSAGRLSRLREHIQEELRGQLGRSKKDFRLWQDKAAIAHGRLWEKEINAAIAESVFFIPIVTPTSLRSHHCKFEFDSFLAREAALGRSDLIFPILYIRVPALEDEAQWRGDPVLNLIGSRQYIDWQRFRHLDVESTEVGMAVDHFCSNICAALHQTWVAPERSRSENQDSAQQEIKRQTEEEGRSKRLEIGTQAARPSIAHVATNGEQRQQPPVQSVAHPENASGRHFVAVFLNFIAAVFLVFSLSLIVDGQTADGTPVLIIAAALFGIGVATLAKLRWSQIAATIVCAVGFAVSAALSGILMINDKPGLFAIGICFGLLAVAFAVNARVAGRKWQSGARLTRAMNALGRERVFGLTMLVYVAITLTILAALGGYPHNPVHGNLLPHLGALLLLDAVIALTSYLYFRNQTAVPGAPAFG